MNHGNILVYILFFLSLGTAFFYIIATLGKVWAGEIGHFLFFMLTAFSFITCALLLILLINDQFQYSYVYGYSKKALSVYFKISAFWAGQQGSFLLWFTLSAILGCVVILKENKFSYEVMLVLSIQQVFLAYLLKSSELFEITPFTATDGHGLNPVLQNFWMVVHPPIIFLGYAAMALPLSYAIAGLIRKEFSNWVYSSFPWTTFASLSMGLGIFIGGYWAYVTLGWGGFWGWDPVENASLIPWLLIVMAFHGQLLQIRKKRIFRLNPVLCILAHSLVLYATFLTRTDILANFSVHSFQGSELKSDILIFIFTFLLGPFIIYSLAWPSMSEAQKKQEKTENVPWLDNTIYIFLVLFGISSIFILIGISWPIISGIIESPSSLEHTFYTNTHLPIGILLSILFIIYVFYKKRLSFTYFIISLIPPFLGSCWAMINGLSSPLYLIFLFVAMCASFLIFILWFTNLRLNILRWVSFLSHLGICLLLVGIILSSLLSQTRKSELVIGKSTEAFGYKFTYEGFTPPLGDWFYLNLIINEKSKIQMKLGIVDYKVMPTPELIIMPWKDIYLTPEINVKSCKITLTKGKSVEVEDILIHFERFFASDHSESSETGKIGAALTVNYQGVDYKATPEYEFSSKGQRSIPYLIPGTFLVFKIDRIMAESGAIEITVEDLSPDSFQLTVSTKPWIIAVWTGTILMSLGLFVTWISSHLR